MTCPACALDLAPSLLACPSCHTLVYGDRLRALAGEARTAAMGTDAAAEMAAWREALTLLPQGSQQHREITSRIEVLSTGLIDRPEAVSSARAAWSTDAIAGVGLLAWKCKALAVLVLTKGKLLLGLTNSTTLLSMLPAVGVYWAVFGWPFAWANLLNLVPVWQLDGAHAFSALDRTQRLVAAAAVGLAFVVSREGLLVLIAILALLQAWRADDTAPGDGVICAQFAGLIAVFTTVLMVGAAPVLP